MSRLPSIRRRGEESEPGQDTTGPPVAAGASDPAPETPGFRDRGKLRRRLRFLRRVRELQLRDLGGLVFETYRLASPRQELVDRKVQVLAATDAEVAGLEAALDDRRPLRELREAGIGGQCPRCGEVHGSAARFCSNCGLGLTARAPALDTAFGPLTPVEAPASGVAPGPAAPAPGPTAAPGVAPGPAASAQAGTVPPVQNLAAQAAAGTPDPASPAPAAAPLSGDPLVSAAGDPSANPAAPGPSPSAGPVPAFDPASPAGPPQASPSPAPARNPSVAPLPNPSAAPVPNPSAAPVPDPAEAPMPNPPAAPLPTASAPSGGQGVASGDPLGQSAATADRPDRRAPSRDLQSGDPLAATPASENDTVILPPDTTNGADETEAAKAPGQSPDDQA